MSDNVFFVLAVTKKDGTVVQDRVLRDATELEVRLLFSFSSPHTPRARRSFSIENSSPFPTTSRS